VAVLSTVLTFYGVSSPPDLRATHEGTAHCPEDVNGDTYIDIINDVASFNNWAFQAVPPAPPEYDISPREGDGFVDIIGDISRVLSLYEQRCVASVLEETFDGPGDSVLSVTGCFHKVYNYLASLTGPGGYVKHWIQASTRCTVAPIVEHSGYCLYSMWWLPGPGQEWV